MNNIRRQRILFCSAPGSDVDSIKAGIRDEGIEFEAFPTIDKALARLESGSFDTFVLRVCSEEDDLEQLEKISIVRKIDPDLPVVIISEVDSIELERAARLQEVFYYLVEPVNMVELKQVLVQSFGLRLRRAERRIG